MAQKIMIVDDEIEILNMLKRFFSLDGYDAVSYTHLTLPTT